MKIIHVPFGFYPDPAGGTESYVASLATGQQSQGIEAIVAAPGEQNAAYTYEALSVRRFAVNGAISDLRALYGDGDARAAAAFGRILDDELPDLVHLHAFTSAVSLRLLREAKRRSLPVVFTYHTPTVSCQRGTLMHWGREVCDGVLHTRRCTACTLHGHGLGRVASVALSQLPPAVGRALGEQGRAGGVWTALRMTELVGLRHTALRALLTEVDAVVALCAWTQALLVRNDVPPSKITVSHHGLSQAQHEHRTPRSAYLPGQRPLRIAFLGRLEPSKGIDLLIQALRSLPEVAVELDIYGILQAGGANYSQQLRDMAADDGRVCFRQPVPGDQVVDLLAGYDLLAVPSQICETGPLVVLDAFAAEGITPLAFGNQPQWPAGHQFSMTLSNLVGREGLDAKLYGESPWNDAATVQAIDIYFRQFQEAGYFPRDPNAVTYEDANALFYAGDAAMLPTGTWLVAEITDNTDFEVGFFPFPAIEGGEGVFPPAGLGGGLFVAEASDDKEAAFEFLNWLQSDEVVRKWSLQTFNVIPAQEIDIEGLEVSPLFESVLGDLAQSSGETSDFGYNIDVLTPANFNDEMFTGFQEVLNGTRTPQELADALDAAYKEAAERGETLERPEE